METFSEEIVQHMLKSIGCKNGLVLSLIGNLIQNLDDREKIFKIFDKKFLLNLTENIKVKFFKNFKFFLNFKFFFFKSKNSIGQSLKVLALCTQNRVEFRKQLIDIDKCNLNKI